MQGPNTILILDDEVAKLWPIQQLLEANSWSATLVEDIDLAMHILKTKTIQVVLVDYQMPKSSGIEFVQEAKFACPNCNFILMSGAPDELVQNFCRDSGIPLLHKPFKTAELLHHLFPLSRKRDAPRDK